MRFLRYIFILSAVIASVSCSKDFTGKEFYRTDFTEVSAKIINNPTVDSPFVLVKMEEGTDYQMIENIQIAGIDSVARVFTSTPGKEELEKKFGLDRWYEFYIDPSLTQTKSPKEGLGEVALSLADLKEVSLIQFPAKADNQAEKEAVPFRYYIRSSSNVFNDPYLSYQWNYLNLGDSSIEPAAQAGADINVYDVWAELSAGDPSIVVAVLDEGVMYNHPDLASHMWTNNAELTGTPGVDDDGNGFIDDFYGYNFVLDDVRTACTSDFS